MKTQPLVWLSVVLLPAFLYAASETDDYLAEWQTKCAALLMEWLKPEADHSSEARQSLIESAMQAEKPEVIEEVAVGGDVARLEIKLPEETRQIEAKVVHDLGEMPKIPYGNSMDCVIRRMTKLRFEAWTPAHGWLFNSKGQIINEAAPPRRDGIGREWHGAFLPDGSWVTTDLWEMDKTLTFFSRNGKWVKEIKAAKLAPPNTDEVWAQSLIGWARCDKLGKGWVVSIGEGPGRARVFVRPDGETRLLDDEDAPWKLCYPRDLEPKGMYTSLQRPSDDFKTRIDFSEAGHGMWVGFPTYRWRNDEEDGTVIPGGDHNFGFLPGSHDVFIGASDFDSGDSANPRKFKTWFFSADGKCRGWVRAAYLADSADRKATWFLDGESCVVEFDSKLKPQARMRFTISGAAVKPVKVFPDLRLGFFKTGAKLVLARW